MFLKKINIYLFVVSIVKYNMYLCDKMLIIMYVLCLEDLHIINFIFRIML